MTVECNYLEELSSGTESINSLLVESIIVHLDKILPAHVLELISVLMQSQTTQPTGNITQELEVGRIFWGLRAATSSTRRSTTSLRVVREVTFVTSHDAKIAHVKSIHVCTQHASIISRKVTVVLGHRQVHVGAGRTRNGNARRARTRAASLEGSELLGLQESGLLGAQDLAEFVGHKNVHVLLLLLILGLAFGRACSAELLDIIELDTVVDSGQSGQLHSCSVGNHVGMGGTLLLCVEVGEHRCVDHGGPAVVGVVRRENIHGGILTGCRDGGVLQVGVARQLEGTRRAQRLAELTHGLLALRRAGSVDGRLVLIAAVVPRRGREGHGAIFLVVVEKG